MSGTIVEKFFRQTVNKLVYRFNIESGVEVGDGSTPGVVTNNSKTYSHTSVISNYCTNLGFCAATCSGHVL